MQVTRKIIEIDEELCDGCGQCIPNCAEGALELVDGKARLLADKYCDGLGACLGDCPTGALRIIERRADDFDEEAVEELLKTQKKKDDVPEATMKIAGRCPSAKMESFQISIPCQAANLPTLQQEEGGPSALSHWPLQVRLVPPSAPFLKNADLLVAADCAPFAYPHFHRDLLAGRVVMVGCPKFDDAKSYIDKFAEIFTKASLKSVTLAIMEVPCCGNMRMIIKEALKQAAMHLPVNEVVISTRGEILKQEKWVDALETVKI